MAIALISALLIAALGCIAVAEVVELKKKLKELGDKHNILVQQCSQLVTQKMLDSKVDLVVWQLKTLIDTKCKKGDAR